MVTQLHREKHYKVTNKKEISKICFMVIPIKVKLA
jgi:hypothetical protein